MADFSSVNLRILSPDGRTVLAELQQIDRAAVRTARNAGDTTAAALSQVQRQTAMSARQVAGNVAQIAAAGAASAESLKGIVTQGANMAFMFGAGGAVAGAVGLTALAIVNLFNRTRREIEETTRKAMEELGRLAEAGNIGAIGGKFGVATKLFSGDRFAARQEDESETAFRVRRQGILGTRAELARLQGIVDANQGGGSIAQNRRQNALNQMREIQRELDKVVPRYERLVVLMREMEGQESFVAGRVVAGRKTSFTAAEDEAQGRRLEKLLGLPGVRASAIGFGPAALNPVEFWEQTVETMREGLKRVPPLPPQELTEDLRRLMAWDEVVEGLSTSLNMTLADGIANGITAAIQTGSIGAAFSAMAGTILEGIGSMMVQVGVQALAFAKIWARLQAFLAANPVAAIPVAIGLIAAGTAVRALGAGMRGSAGGGGFGGGSRGGYGGGGYGSGSTIIDRGLINPLNGVVTAPGNIVPRESVVYNFTVIGENDPVAQRTIVRMVDKGNARRGS